MRHLLDCHQQTVEDPNDFPSDTLPYRRLGSDPFDVWSVNAVLRYIAARPDPSTYNTARHRLRLLAHPRGALLSIIIISASVSCFAVFNPGQRLPFEAPHCWLQCVIHCRLSEHLASLCHHLRSRDKRHRSALRA